MELLRKVTNNRCKFYKLLKGSVRGIITIIKNLFFSDEEIFTGAEIDKIGVINRKYAYKSVIGCLLAAAFGAIFFLMLFSELFDVTYVDWIFASGGDITQHYIGWNFFRNSEWTFPLGVAKNYSYPGGIAITYTDSVPLLAFIFKLFNSFLPINFQYFGIWYLICFMLQGIFSYLLVSTIIKDRVTCLLASILFIISPIMLFRMLMHSSLAGHWVILMALWFVMKKDKKLKMFRWIYTLCISIIIHPYLFFIVGSIMIIDILNIVFISKTIKVWEGILALVKIIIVVTLFSYAVGIFYTDNSDGGWFGYYSMNLNALINPMNFSRFLKNLPWGDGQYEGFNYLGAGIIILLSISLFHYLMLDRKIISRLKSNWPIFLVSGLLTLLALSNKVYIGKFLIFSWETNISIINKIAGTFRSSGRMFWPVYYLLITTALLVLNKVKPKYSRVIVVLIVAIQLYDLGNAFHIKGDEAENKVWNTPLKSSFWDIAKDDYNKVYYIPGYDLNSYHITALWASDNGKKLNSGYVAREPKGYQKSINEQINQLKSGNLSKDTLYIFTSSVYEYIKNINLEGSLLGYVDGHIVLAPNFTKNHPNQTYQMYSYELGSFLAGLNKNYLTIMSVKDEGTQSLNDNVFIQMKKLGLSDTLKGKFRYSYIGIGGEKVKDSAVEITQLHKAEVSYSKGDKLGSTVLPFNLKVVSAGDYAGNVSSIMIDGIEYSKNMRGINIVIYDLETKKVIESTVFDTYAGLFR